MQNRESSRGKRREEFVGAGRERRGGGWLRTEVDGWIRNWGDESSGLLVSHAPQLAEICLDGAGSSCSVLNDEPSLAFGSTQTATTPGLLNSAWLARPPAAAADGSQNGNMNPKAAAARYTAGERRWTSGSQYQGDPCE